MFIRKACFVILFAVLTNVCSSQVKVSVFAGPQSSSSKYIVNGKKQSDSNKYGFQLGTNLKVPFDNKLYFSPAVFYSLKGYKMKFNQASMPPDPLAIDNNTTIHTFELAALLHYDFNSQPAHFFVGFGPSLDVQLWGKEKFNRSTDISVNQEMVFSFTKYGRYGANILLQFGYETGNRFFISGQYTHGIGSINNADYGPGIWHRVYGVSIGKYLGKNK